MATINNYIRLHDGFSPVMAKITKASDAAANKMETVSRTTNKMASAFSNAEQRGSMLGDVLKGSLGAGLILKGLDMATDAVKKLFGSADEYAGIQARLNLVAGSQQNAIALNNMIYESAQRARAGYNDTAEAVSQLAMSAKDAFPDPREAVTFMEGINKLFTIGGASNTAKQAATLQLTQGMSSGVLQGDEFRSIAEQAPLIENYIAKSMGVSRGELKALSSEGQVTAEVIKKAIFENMAEINEQFESMPMTWGNSMTAIQNYATRTFRHVFEAMSGMANSESLQKMTQGVEMAINVAANAMMFLVNNAMWLAGVITDGLGAAFDFLKNNMWLVYGVMGVLGGYVAWLGALWVIQATQMAIAAAGTAAKVIADMAETAALIALTFAQDGFNAALYDCPITWIVALIIGFIAVIYGAVAMINYFAGTSISATGIIAGAFGWLFGVIRAGVAFVWNIFVALAEFLANVFHNPLQAISNLFAEIWNGVVDLVKVAINQIIGMINKVPGVNIDTIGGDFGHLTVQHTGDMVDMSAYKMNTGFGDSDPMRYGGGAYNAGENLSNQIGNIFSMENYGKQDTTPFDESKINPAAAAHDPNNGKTAKNTGRTAKNTERMAKAIEMSDEDIKSLRDSAISETLQKWQSQHVEIKVDNTITATSDVDLDGFTSDFAKGLRNAIQAQSEGVFA